MFLIIWYETDGIKNRTSTQNPGASVIINVHSQRSVYHCLAARVTLYINVVHNDRDA